MQFGEKGLSYKMPIQKCLKIRNVQVLFKVHTSNSGQLTIMIIFMFAINYPNDKLTLNFFLMKVILAGVSDKIKLSLQSETVSSGFFIVALITGLNLHKPAAFLEVFVLLPVKPV